MFEQHAIQISFYDLVKEFVLTREPSLLKPVIAELGDLKQYVRAPNAAHEAYSRTVLYSTPELEIMVACWRQNQECLPHDHGYSNGCVINLLGRFIETSYIWSGGKLVSDEKYIHNHLNSLLDIGAADIHSMHCTDAVGLTLHMYSPAIDDMKVFDLAHERTLVVANNCGSWIPTDESQILKVQSWNKN